MHIQTKNILAFLSVMIIFVVPVFAESPSVRIKDIASIREVRENQLMGFGLVVGLRQTGDSQQTEFTKQALTNLLTQMGLQGPSPLNTSGTNPIYNLSNVPRAQEFRSKNVAAVMVTANLPPFAKPGKRIDVTVSSLGDATSLRGGTLLLTPLEGADDNVYAVAQGPVSIGSVQTAGSSVVNTDVTTSGKVPNGAIVEREVIANFESVSAMDVSEEAFLSGAGSASYFSVVLNEPDFTTASRVAYTIVQAGIDAKAEDASTITVASALGEDIIDLISRVESLTVVPDVRAKVVINERTGTIVIGENVRIAPVAVTYGHIVVTISQPSRSDALAGLSPIQSSNVTELNKPFTEVGGGATLGDLIRSLNAIGASSRELVSILQAIKSSGAMNTEIEVM
ncbi:MAG: flagellar basal body P-ring protein FlgI [Candidatus Margulisiibacteriota bacterium]